MEIKKNIKKHASKIVWVYHIAIGYYILQQSYFGLGQKNSGYIALGLLAFSLWLFHEQRDAIIAAGTKIKTVVQKAPTKTPRQKPFDFFEEGRG